VRSCLALRSLLVLLILLPIVAGTLLAPVRAAGPQEPVQLTSGPITGANEEGVRAYRGIPYAAPPVGELRWRPPQAVAPWTEPRAMTAFGPACPQRVSELNRGLKTTDEDCLYLNVWTPAASAAEGLPVMVWIHGGGFVQGSASLEAYSGGHLAQRGVVVVTINYRLGPLGFLALPALTAESEHGASGNYGLMDQIFALQWVRDNIRAFGGDPGRVTIFGESAGAVSVYALMASPLARGLFVGAIAESGSPPAGLRSLREGTRLRPSAEEAGLKFAAKLGVEDGPDMLAALRAKSSAEILAQTGESGPTPGASMAETLSLDGWVLPEEPAAVFAEHRQAPVPLIAGSNQDEGTLWARNFRNMTVRKYELMLRGVFRNQAQEALALYPAADDAQAAQAIVTLMGDGFHQGARRAVRGSAPVQPQAYLYYFTQTTDRLRQMGLGCCHGSEIPYVFGNLAPAMGYADADQELSTQIMGYWTRFAATGDPNGEGAVPWPAYTEAGDAHLVLGVPIAAGENLRKDALDFLESARAGL
jgi:para-nitrobenzyl esterase